MRLTTTYHTPNASLMMTGKVVEDVQGGIDNPSDSLIVFGRALYRVSTATRRNRTTGAFSPSPAESAYQSNWWATADQFLAETWFSEKRSMSVAGREAYAIHPAWETDCANVTTIRLKTDLACWYGMGKTISLEDPRTKLPLIMHGSPNTLQLYIPGLKENYDKWAFLEGTVPFGS